MSMTFPSAFPELIPIENAGLYEVPGPAVSDVEAALRRDRVAKIPLGLGRVDFEELSDAFAGCIEEAVPTIGDTLHMVDPRYGHTAGYFRKDRKVDESGRQIEDPKHVFQFNEQAQGRWR